MKHPEALVEWVLAADVIDVYIDSLKDIMSPLSSDEVGSAYNRGIGAVIAAGVEAAGNHHQRKANNDNRKPTSLADVYGSTWITSGAGSVLCLWGQPGDPLVELSHLKQPAEQVGPLDLEHDHDRGQTTRRDRPDAWSLLQGATAGGIGARDAAAAIYSNPTRADVEKVRRRLERFVDRGQAVLIEAKQANEPNLYRPIAPNGTVRPREANVNPSRAAHARPQTPGNTDHATLTHPHATAALTSPLKEWGEREGADPAEQDPNDLLIAEHEALQNGGQLGSCPGVAAGADTRQRTQQAVRS